MEVYIACFIVPFYLILFFYCVYYLVQKIKMSQSMRQWRQNAEATHFPFTGDTETDAAANLKSLPVFPLFHSTYGHQVASLTITGSQLTPNRLSVFILMHLAGLGVEKILLCRSLWYNPTVAHPVDELISMMRQTRAGNYAIAHMRIKQEGEVVRVDVFSDLFPAPRSELGYFITSAINELQGCAFSLACCAFAPWLWIGFILYHNLSQSKGNFTYFWNTLFMPQFVLVNHHDATVEHYQQDSDLESERTFLANLMVNTVNNLLSQLRSASQAPSRMGRKVVPPPDQPKPPIDW
jgi:hypothetical protein